MLIRDTGTAWQIVLQPDHADLSGQFVHAWSPSPDPFQSLEVVARRHDDGWAVWERGPGLDSEGRPRNFLDVQVPSHLAFYRAAIAAVTDQDRYAGLILSMHGAGIYQQRYGTQPSLPRLSDSEEHGEEIDAFIREQESSYPTRREELEITEEESWRSYKLLQTWDRLSLYFCLKDLDGGTADTIEAMPWDGTEVELKIEPRGPWQVALEPYPFGSRPASFSFQRRLFPQRSWSNDDAFRDDFFAAELEEVDVAVEPLV